MKEIKQKWWEANMEPSKQKESTKRRGKLQNVSADKKIIGKILRANKTSLW